MTGYYNDDALTLKGWQQENAELQDEIDRLKKLATQRAARLQIMREWMRSQPAGGLNPVSILDAFEDDRPESVDWFDIDGVPVAD